MQFDNRVVVADDAPALAFRTYYVESRLSTMNRHVSLVFPYRVEDVLALGQYVVINARERLATHDEANVAAWRSLNTIGHRREPLLVLSYGTQDAVDFLSRFPADDLELPPDAVRRWPMPEIENEPLRAGALSWQEARHWAWSRLQPAHETIMRLRRAGFSKIAFLAAWPLHPDDHSFAVLMRTLGIALPAERRRLAFRYKLLALVNEVLAALCQDEDVRFIDMWPTLTSNGILRREFIAHDLMHLTDHVVEQLAAGVVATAAREAFADDLADATGSETAYAAGDWVSHDTIGDAAIVTDATRHPGRLLVSRPAIGHQDAWPLSRVRPASSESIARAKRGAAS